MAVSRRSLLGAPAALMLKPAAARTDGIIQAQIGGETAAPELARRLDGWFGTHQLYFPNPPTSRGQEIIGFYFDQRDNHAQGHVTRIIMGSAGEPMVAMTYSNNTQGFVRMTTVLPGGERNSFTIPRDPNQPITWVEVRADGQRKTTSIPPNTPQHREIHTSSRQDFAELEQGDWRRLYDQTFGIICSAPERLNRRQQTEGAQRLVAACGLSL